MRNLIVKDFETNNTADNGGKYRFNNMPFWQDLRAGTTIVLRRLAGPTGYVQDTDASDFTLDLLLENPTYLTNLATGNIFNITQTDMVVIRPATRRAWAGPSTRLAPNRRRSAAPSALYQSVTGAKLISPDSGDAGGAPILSTTP